jgi:hypothetical protein
MLFAVFAVLLVQPEIRASHIWFKRITSIDRVTVRVRLYTKHTNQLRLGNADIVGLNRNGNMIVAQQ